MRNPRKHQKPVIGIGIAALVAVLGLAALASDSARFEKPAAVDAEQYAEFIENEVFDVQDLAEGAEIQRRWFNRITPPGFSWVQPIDLAPVSGASRNDRIPAGKAKETRTWEPRRSTRRRRSF